MSRASAGIRELRDEDAPAVAELARELLPEWLVTAELVVHWARRSPERARTRFWVGEEERRIVGCAVAELDWTSAEPGSAHVWVGVLPGARGRGLGSRLYAAAERHLAGHGARRLRASVGADPAGARFAERLGFVETRRERMSQLDVRSADLSELGELTAAAAADGFRVAPLRALLDRPRELHALYAEAAADMPADEPHTNLPFDEWERETLGNPLLDRDASMTVLDGERPVSFAWLLVDRAGGRGAHQLTGTLRAYRGRGLARLAKLAALRWCAEHGIHTLLTGNDSTNAPMLAINDRLGYRPTIVARELAKRL